jgi:hypothetical protein
MGKKEEEELLKEVAAHLNPPSEKELNEIIAKWLFGENADKMLLYAPWSFILLKLMWVKGEEPWRS